MKNENIEMEKKSIVQKGIMIYRENILMIREIIRAILLSAVYTYACVGVITTIFYLISKNNGGKEIYVPSLMKCSIKAMR